MQLLNQVYDLLSQDSIFCKFGKYNMDQNHIKKD